MEARPRSRAAWASAPLEVAESESSQVSGRFACVYKMWQKWFAQGGSCILFLRFFIFH